jgi:mannose-6-phosphate isomerase-like protein (cupin superfamily)
MAIPGKIQAGFETTDPRSGTRMVVLEGAEETKGRGWWIEVHCPEGAPPSVPEHFHDAWTESFEVLEGTATYRLAGVEGVLAAGGSVVLSPGVKHVHPWNTGSGPLIYRQRSDFGAVRPTAVQDVLGVFATLNGLAREGKVTAKGLPKHPLQFAATLRTLVQHGGYDASAPRGVQRMIGAILGRFAEALGYRGSDPRYW